MSIPDHLVCEADVYLEHIVLCDALGCGVDAFEYCILGTREAMESSYHFILRQPETFFEISVRENVGVVEQHE